MSNETNNNRLRIIISLCQRGKQKYILLTQILKLAVAKTQTLFSSHGSFLTFSICGHDIRVSYSIGISIRCLCLLTCIYKYEMSYSMTKQTKWYVFLTDTYMSRDTR